MQAEQKTRGGVRMGATGATVDFEDIHKLSALKKILKMGQNLAELDIYLKFSLKSKNDSEEGNHEKICN